MPGDLDSVFEKFEWAGDHVKRLIAEVNAHRDARPFTTVINEIDEPGTHAFQVTMQLRRPVPSIISHIVGDAVNSMQGTLDYLAWQLCLREGQTPGGQTYFPILGLDGKGNPPIVNVGGGKRPTASQPGLLSDAQILAVLDEVQPYRWADPERNPLRVLSELNRKSKHRHPAVLATTVQDAHHVYSPAFAPGVAWMNPNFGPRKDRDEIAWVPAEWAPPEGLPVWDDFLTIVSLDDNAIDPGSGAAIPVENLLVDIGEFIQMSVLRPIELAW